MPSPSRELVDWMTLLSNLVVFLGVIGAPFALLAFLRERRREREERQLMTFTTLSTMYIDYLRLCFDNPGLACTEAQAVSPGTSHIERDHTIMLQIVISMLEASYFLYRNQDSALQETQWRGWNTYIRDWCRHPEFRRRWPDIISQYDKSFVDHISRLYADVNVVKEKDNEV